MLQRNAQYTVLELEEGSFATRNSQDYKNSYGRGLNLIVTLANKAGTVGFTPKVQGKTPAGVYYDLWTAAAELLANGVAVYQLTPEEVATATGVTESKIALLPAVFRVVLELTTGAGDGNEFDTLVEADVLI